MPLYEYVCGRCASRFTQLRAIANRDRPARCPHCAGAAARVMSRFTHKWLLPRRPEIEHEDESAEFDAFAVEEGSDGTETG